MAALLERAHALPGRADRALLRAEVVPVEREVPGLQAFRDRLPVARLAAPGAIGASERIGAKLGARAAHPLEAHVVHAVARARDDDIADFAVRRDLERRAVDEDAEGRSRGVAQRHERARTRVRGWLGRRRGGFLLALALVVRLADRHAERRTAGNKAKRECERALQERSRASAARTSPATSAAALYCGWSMPILSAAPSRRARREGSASSNRRKCTAEVFSSLSRSMSSSATATTRSPSLTCVQTRRSTPFSAASLRRRSSGSGYSISIVAFQLPPSGMSGL